MQSSRSPLHIPTQSQKQRPTKVYPEHFILRKRSEQSIPFDTSDIAEIFPPVLLMAELPRDQYGQLTPEAFKMRDGRTTQCYFCRVGDDVRDGRETWDNPLYNAYRNRQPISSGLWEGQRGRWVLGVEIYVVLHDHKFYWCQQRPSFSTFLNLPCEKARSERFSSLKGFVHVKNPIELFTKTIFLTDLKAPPAPSKYTRYQKPQSYQDGVSFLQKWTFFDSCPWKCYGTPAELQDGELNHAALTQRLLKLSSDKSYQSRILDGVQDLSCCQFLLEEGSQRGAATLKATGCMDENGMVCCCVKNTSAEDTNGGGCALFALNDFLPLIEARDNLRNIAESFMDVPLRPILKNCKKRPWAYYKTIPPLKSDGHPDFEKIRSVLTYDVDRFLLHLRHHYYEGNVREGKLSTRSSSGQPDYRWRWYLKARKDFCKESELHEVAVQSVRDSDNCPESHVRLVSLKTFVILLSWKNQKNIWPNCKTSYTNFELLEVMESRSPGYTCPTPPDPKGPYGDQAYKVLCDVEVVWIWRTWIWSVQP